MVIIFDREEAELVKDFTGLNFSKTEEKSIIKPMCAGKHCVTSKTGDVTISTSDYEAMKVHISNKAVVTILSSLAEIGVWAKPLIMKLDLLSDKVTDMFDFKK